MQTRGFRAVGHELRGVPRSASVALHIPRNATEGVPYSAKLRICTPPDGSPLSFEQRHLHVGWFARPFADPFAAVKKDLLDFVQEW